eukprot:1985623-Prymnesium_polylepis.1
MYSQTSTPIGRLRTPSSRTLPPSPSEERARLPRLLLDVRGVHLALLLRGRRLLGEVVHDEERVRIVDEDLALAARLLVQDGIALAHPRLGEGRQQLDAAAQ